MPSPDIHIVISELAGLFDELNKHWGNDPCTTDAYQVYRQKEYRDVHEKLQGINIESIVVKVVAEGINEKVLTRLRGLIRENVRIYEARQDDINAIDFDNLYQLWENYLFANRRASLRYDRETIEGYPYPTERERTLLLKENQQDINTLDNECYELRRADGLWIGKNYYRKIYDLSWAAASILDAYFPDEQKTDVAVDVPAKQQEPEELSKSGRTIAPDEIFRTRMYDKFREIEARLIRDKYLDENLNWMPRHKNDKPDIKKLVTLLAALIDNNYFLPNRDAGIKAFFEARYRLSIGQNFERKRREPLLGEYKAAFYNYPF